jgi:DNA-binding response OmpR family regulator
MSPTAPVRSTSSDVPSVVVVDPRFDAYKALAASARQGRIDLHLRSSGFEALRLGDRVEVDAWIVAADLDDMSGHDLVELLQSQAGGSPVAMVIDDADGRRRVLAEQAATEAGADEVLSHPISLLDLERLLGLTAEERAREFVGQPGRRQYVTLPVGVGAAAIAMVVLMMG